MERLPSRIPALDGIRGLAICLVLVRHCLGQSTEAAAQPGNWQFEVHYWTKLGWCGVDLFFVLSGFLIAKVLLENLDSPKFFRTFYSRRACRILPLYALVVASMFLARRLLPHGALWDWLFEGQYPWQNYATLTQNFPMAASGHAGGNALGVTWSLAVEEQFYIVLPLLLWLLPRRVLPWFFAAGLPAAWLLRIFWSSSQSYYLMPARADELLLGGLLAWLCLRPKVLGWCRRQGILLLALLALFGTRLLAINRMPEYYGVEIYTWLALFFGTLLLIGVSQERNWITRFLEARWLGYMGLISYGLYLLHRPVQALVYGLSGRTPGAPLESAAELWLPAAAVALSVLLAACSWRYFEKRWVELGHRLRF